jgi:hypothetical protein
MAEPEWEDQAAGGGTIERGSLSVWLADNSEPACKAVILGFDSRLPEGVRQFVRPDAAAHLLDADKVIRLRKAANQATLFVLAPVEKTHSGGSVRWMPRGARAVAYRQAEEGRPAGLTKSPGKSSSPLPRVAPNTDIGFQFRRQGALAPVLTARLHNICVRWPFACMSLQAT